jgi:hypothetical protein
VPDQQTITEPDSGILSRMGELVQEWQPVIASIPDAGGDGELNIVLSVLKADSVDAIDSPWNSSGLLDYVDKPITVTGIRKSPSDFSDGFGFFLLVDCLREDGASRFTLTTGSVSVVAQLIKMHALKAFPRTVIPREAAKLSAAGYRPVHLELVRS